MTKFKIGDEEYAEEINTSYDEDQPIGDEPQAYYASGAEPIDAQAGDDFIDQTYGDPPLPANEEDKKPMNADNPSKITKIGKNQTLIEPAEESLNKDGTGVSRASRGVNINKTPLKILRYVYVSKSDCPICKQYDGHSWAIDSPDRPIIPRLEPGRRKGNFTHPHCKCKWVHVFSDEESYKEITDEPPYGKKIVNNERKYGTISGYKMYPYGRAQETDVNDYLECQACPAGNRKQFFFNNYSEESRRTAEIALQKHIERDHYSMQKTLDNNSSFGKKLQDGFMYAFDGKPVEDAIDYITKKVKSEEVTEETRQKARKWADGQGVDWHTLSRSQQGIVVINYLKQELGYEVEADEIDPSIIDPVPLASIALIGAQALGHSLKHKLGLENDDSDCPEGYKWNRFLKECQPHDEWMRDMDATWVI